MARASFRRLRAVALGILAQRLRRAAEEGVELRHHPPVPVDVLLRGRLSRRHLRHLVLDQRHALAPHRVAQRIGVDVAGGEKRVLAAEMVEHVEHRLRVAARRREIAQARLVRARLVAAAVGERAPVRHLRGSGGDGEARLRRAARRGRKHPEHPDGGDPPPALQRLAAPGLVPAGEWPSSWAITAAQLVDGSGLGHHPGVDEDVLPAGDEGVRLPVVDDVDPHRSRVHPGGAEERVGDAPERVLDLGVADQRQRRRRPAAPPAPPPPPRAPP